VTGGSSTAVTVVVTASVSVRGPPDPVLPRSLVVTTMVAVPSKFGFGVRTRPSSAVPTADTVPRNVVVASATPSPAVKLTPPVPPSVTVPLVAVSVVWTRPVPASRSATTIPLPAAAKNTSTVSSGWSGRPGT
jgi:hypothetical protein